MCRSRFTILAIIGVILSVLPLGRGDTEGGNPSLSREGPSAETRALYERKLLVTKADLVRYVFLTNARDDGDGAVAIYQTRDANKSSPVTYSITAMVASDSLRAKHVVVRRHDAALPASTAAIVHKLWSEVLTRTRVQRWVLCGPMAIFSVATVNGVQVTAIAIGFDENSVARAMINIGEQLIEYPQLAANKRPAAARKIQQSSYQLLQRVEHAKRLTK